MEAKDWVLLILPIIANGVIVFVVQKIVLIKIEQLQKRNSIRDEVIKFFWEKLQSLNDIFIQANISVKNDNNSLFNELTKINKAVLEIIKYYDSNKYDLEIYSKEYTAWENSWNIFATSIDELSNSLLTPEEQLRLGSELQEVKENTQKLIYAVREKY